MLFGVLHSVSFQRAACTHWAHRAEVQTSCIERGNVLCMPVIPSYVGHTVMIQAARELEHASAAFVWINICGPERSVRDCRVSLLFSLYLNLI